MRSVTDLPRGRFSRARGWGRSVEMEFAMFSKASERRFTLIFIAAEVTITIVVGSTFFAALARVLL